MGAHALSPCSINVIIIVFLHWTSLRSGSQRAASMPEVIIDGSSDGQNGSLRSIQLPEKYLSNLQTLFLATVFAAVRRPITELSQSHPVTEFPSADLLS
jgi:hypothetical protein